MTDDPKKILSDIKKSVVDFDADACKKACQKALTCRIDPMAAIMEGLLKGMEKVGVLFDTNEYFVPEVLMSTDTFYEGLDILKPFIPRQKDTSCATIILGVIQGDIHDVGKNLVKMMFETAGWEVHDLGRDVPLEAFLEKQLEIRADVVAISSMMTTTMMGMKKLIRMIRSRQPDAQIMIGGAPVTRDIAYLFGANGYADSAGKAVAEALRMIEDFNTHKYPQDH